MREDDQSVFGVNPKGSRTLIVLKTLAEAACSATDIITAILSAPYGASIGRLGREVRKYKHERFTRAAQRQEIERERERYYSLLYKLKRDGLIINKQNKGRRLLALTQTGRFKMEQLQCRKRGEFPPYRYPKTKEGEWIIVSFDIPELERRKRFWLRQALKNIGFRMVQKSVWIGKVRLPEYFLEDIHQLKLSRFVEIFIVTRIGSLEHGL